MGEANIVQDVCVESVMMSLYVCGKCRELSERKINKRSVRKRVRNNVLL